MDRLYNLLPAVYRVEDAARGSPLRGLLAAIESEVLGPIEAEIRALRDVATIETCPDWAIPYIGDLLGVTPLRPGGPGALRAFVANTLAYRRRKGTTAVIEQLARDVTGLPAHVVEYFDLLAATQNDDHVRPRRPGTADLRRAGRAELIGGPFEDAPYTVEVRRAETRRGRYNIPDVAIWLWCLASFAVQRGQARRVAAGQWTFHPLGLDAPLFNRPRTETEITELAGEQHVPEPLRPLALHAELETLRAGHHEPIWFGEQPVLEITSEAGLDALPIDPVDIHICNLTDWHRPPDGVAVDPRTGRIAFPPGVDPAEVLVSYAYGFGGDVGGGPSPRPAPVPWRPTWQVGVSLDHGAVGTETIHTSLADAVAEWNALEPGADGVVVLMDSRSYDLAAPVRIEIKAGSRLLVVAAEWPAVEIPGAFDVRARPAGRYQPRGVRPCLIGNLEVVATGERGELILDNLLLAGRVTAAAGPLDRLELRYCTLALRAHADIAVPAASLEVVGSPRLALVLDRCLSGPLVIAAPIAGLEMRDSIVAGRPGVLALDAAASPATITACTILGDARVRSLHASDSLFDGACVVQRSQVGCARFSYFGPGSSTPRRYRCQPDLALAERAAAFAPNPLPPAEAVIVASRVRPHFVSGRYGDPGFGTLDTRTAVEIRTGAESGAELGAFEHLQRALGEANLRSVLVEYLPFGLQAGIFYRS